MNSLPTCILCGAPLPADRRWRIIQVLSPRFPACEPSAACYRGLAHRMGYDPSETEIAEQVDRAKRIR